MKRGTMLVVFLLVITLLTSCINRTVTVGDIPHTGVTEAPAVDNTHIVEPSTPAAEEPEYADITEENTGESREPSENETLQVPRSFLPASDYNMTGERVYYRDCVVVLTYHHISTEPLTGITIKPERFEADLKMLRDEGFNVISLRDTINGIQGDAELPPNAVAITFDDGYKSFYQYGYPALQKYNMPAVCFIITSWTEGIYPLNKNFDSLNPEEIKEMYKSGLVDIQSHSHFGHDYIIRNHEGKSGGFLAFQIYDQNTGLYENEESYRNRVYNDLSQSISIIAKYTGSAPDMLCFPFGHFNNRLVEISKGAGFKYFITTMYGNNKENSKSTYIYRIRSGDLNLTPEKLRQNIIDCGIGRRPATQ